MNATSGQRKLCIYTSLLQKVVTFRAQLYSNAKVLDNQLPELITCTAICYKLAHWEENEGNFIKKDLLNKCRIAIKRKNTVL